MLPKHWWEGTDKSGNKRDVTQTTLEPPLGSGPYRVKDVAPGRTIVYEKVPDYWGKDVNVNVGTNNFQQMRFDYYRDSDVALQAFKADDVDWRTENIAQELGDRLRFPRRARAQGRARGISDPQLRRHAGVRLQHPARQVQGRSACAAPSISPSISRR